MKKEINLKRMQAISSNITKYRKELGITQKELAEKVGVTPSTMSDYINLRSAPSFGVIQKLADFFGVQKTDIDSEYQLSHKEKYEVTPNNESSTLSDINKISAKLSEPRKKVVLDTATSQLAEQEEIEKAAKAKPKITPLFDMDSPLTDEELQEAVDEAVAFDGVPLTDREKELYKHLLREAWEEDHGRG
ncbi:MAG: helix-turn-helix domain-containing protein [Lactococcus lactis]